MFNTLESHTINPEEAKKRKEAQIKAENDAIAERVAASLAASNEKAQKEAARREEDEIKVVEE